MRAPALSEAPRTLAALRVFQTQPEQCRRGTRCGRRSRPVVSHRAQPGWPSPAPWKVKTVWSPSCDRQMAGEQEDGAWASEGSLSAQATLRRGEAWWSGAWAFCSQQIWVRIPARGSQG